MAQAVMAAEPQALAAAATTMVAESLAAVNINEDVNKKNRIQVSNTKKPLFFYLNLAKAHFFLSFAVNSCFFAFGSSGYSFGV